MSKPIYEEIWKCDDAHYYSDESGDITATVWENVSVNGCEPYHQLMICEYIHDEDDYHIPLDVKSDSLAHLSFRLSSWCWSRDVQMREIPLS